MEIAEDKPVLVDKYNRRKEVESDAICDGTDLSFRRYGTGRKDRCSFWVIPLAYIPRLTYSDKVKETILDYAKNQNRYRDCGIIQYQFIVVDHRIIY